MLGAARRSVPAAGWERTPRALQMGAPGPWQVATGLNVATEGRERPVAAATINCSDRLGCRASAGVRCPTGSTGFALRGAGLEGKERRFELKHLRWMKEVVQVGCSKLLGCDQRVCRGCVLWNA